MSLADKIKAKLDALANKQNNTSEDRPNNKFKPVPGKQVIRILPNTELGLTEEPFYPLDFYYDFGSTMLAPCQFDEPDAIFEFFNSLLDESKPLMQTDKDKSKELYKQALKFKPKTAIFVPVLVREKEAEGVKFWSISVKTYEKIKSIIEDDDYGQIWDLKSGHDLTVDYTPKDKTATGYPEISIVAKPKKTPVSTDQEVISAIKNMPKLSEMYKKPTYAETKDALEKYLGKQKEPAPAPVVEKTQSNEDFLKEISKPVDPVGGDFDADLDGLFNED